MQAKLTVEAFPEKFLSHTKAAKARGVDPVKFGSKFYASSSKFKPILVQQPAHKYQLREITDLVLI